MNDAPERFFTFKKIRRVVWRAVKALLVLLLILAVVHSVATIVNGRRVEAKLKELKAAGNPISCAELGMPKVPDNENAALVYAKAFKVLKTLEKEEDSEVIDTIFIRKNSFNTKQNWSDARAVLDRYKSVFPLIEQAVSLPKCQFPVKWESGWSATFPHYLSLRKLTRLLVIRAIVQAHDGDMNGAIHSIELGFRMSECANDPTLSGQYVRKGMIVITARGLEQVLQYGDISEAQGAHLYQVLGSIDMVPGYLKAMQGERTFGIWAFDFCLKKTNEFLCLLSSSEESLPMNWKLSCLIFIWRPVLYADEMHYLRYMDMLNDLARKPYREAKHIFKDVEKNSNIPKWAVITRILTPVYGRVRMRVDEATAMIEGSRIILALKVYKNRHGAYPESLDELRSRLGWELPKDPFSGKDFIYRREGKGFILYSVGGNLQDDKAQPVKGSFAPTAPRKEIKTPSIPEPHYGSDPKYGDIVWRM